MGPSTVTVGRTHVGNVNIAYESVGTGDPALMLIHGAFEDRSYFASQTTSLVGRRRVVAIDLRGHGESSSASEVSIDDFAADVIGVADDAGLGSVVLCGHSMAGVVALKVAQARPHQVRGVALLDGTVLFPDTVRRMAIENLLPALATNGWLEALRGYFSWTFDPQDPPELARRVMADLGRTRPEFARSLFTHLFASDYADDLTNAPRPLLYIHAKAPTDLQRLQELRPDAMIGQVVGAGHYLMLSAPDQVNAMLDRFLSVIDAAAPSS